MSFPVLYKSFIPKEPGVFTPLGIMLTLRIFQDDEEEEMPIEARQRMRNMGR